MTATRNMTMDELLALNIRVPLRTAAAALGIGQNDAYRQAQTGSIEGVPVLKRGGQWVVTRPDLFRALGLPPDMMRAPGNGEAA